MESTDEHKSGPSHRWEVPVETWAEVREVVRERLVRSARMPHLIAYSNLAAGLPFEGPHSHALAAMLGEINRECVGRGEPLLAAVAVYISGQSKDEPGPGFYVSAMELGKLKRGTSKEEQRDFWAMETGRCFDYWKGRR